MAQSSSSSWSYDVFLNFKDLKDEDTLMVNFIENLFCALRDKRIRTFKNLDEGISKGGGQIMKAIQKSRAAIVIFSENYASSTSCLEQLVKIMECRKNQGMLVWPICYHVDPSNLGDEEGSYAEALARHEGNILHKEKVETWRSALQEAANLVCWHIEHWGEYDEFISEITEEVFEVILPWLVEFWGGRYGRDQEKVRITQSKNEGSQRIETRAYSLTQILRITNGFERITKIGGFGKVHVGTLSDKTPVVVRRMFSSNPRYDEFELEVKLLSSLHHKNLVSLIGYCSDGDYKALIYEHVGKQNLQTKLSDKNSNVLKWKERLQIAIDAAQGLDYLHNCCKPSIIHRDLKPVNILLNANMEAKIAEFGFLRAFINDNDTHLATASAGRSGYSDPLHQISKDRNVYSFGIILFELITGQPVNKKPDEEEIHMSDRVIPESRKGHIQTIIDRRLEGNFSEASAKKAIDVAWTCISVRAAKRPVIRQVLAELKECLALEMEITDGNEMGSLQHQSNITDNYPRHEYSSSDVTNDAVGLESQVEHTNSLGDVESNDEVQMCGEMGSLQHQLTITDNYPWHEYSSSDVTNDAVGLESQVEHTNSLVDIESNEEVQMCSETVMITESKNEGSLRFRTRAYPYSEIVRITDSFKAPILGEGGFGKVYLGTLLHEGTQVAVKLRSLSSQQGHKEFQSEVELLMSIHHRNLVSLKGYCNEGDAKALIYEYMDNGDLHKKLSEKNNVLKWKERLQIAIDAAKGLDYLHNDCTPPIIHRDLKPANILLNANMRAKIADFGISKAYANDDDTHAVTTRIHAGTDGYRDPRRRITKKSDIYSFGIILFELITGQPVFKKASSGEEIHMEDWVIDEIENGHNIIDPRLEGNSSIASVFKAIDVASACILSKAAKRPDISHALAELKECLALENNTDGMGSL